MSNETENKKEHKKRSGGMSSFGGFVFAFICIAAFLYLGRQTALIVSPDGKYSKAKIVCVMVRSVIVSSRSIQYEGEEEARNAEMISTIAMVKSVDVARIEYVNEIPQVTEEETPSEPGVSSPVTGSYAVNVSGFKGTMRLYLYNGNVIGDIQFPGWAKVVKEPLKRLRFRGKHIYFTRSVETASEQKKVGSPTLFTQNFDGEFMQNGKVIRGYFTNHGAKEYWDALKK